MVLGSALEVMVLLPQEPCHADRAQKDNQKSDTRMHTDGIGSRRVRVNPEPPLETAFAAMEPQFAIARDANRPLIALYLIRPARALGFTVP